VTRDSYKPKVPLGEVIQSFAFGKVLESRHPELKAGDLARCDFGWQDRLGIPSPTCSESPAPFVPTEALGIVNLRLGNLSRDADLSVPIASITCVTLPVALHSQLRSTSENEIVF
jgi:NADPH-dependent curcumin reductase CurA